MLLQKSRWVILYYLTVYMIIMCRRPGKILLLKKQGFLMPPEEVDEKEKRKW